MNSENISDNSTADAKAAAALMSAGRRRLLRGGVGAAPVLLTFISRPVPADIGPAPGCKSSSAAVSANASGVVTVAPGVGCSGRGPAEWASMPGNWGTYGGAVSSPGTKVSAVLAGYPAGFYIADVTLLQVLTGGGSDEPHRLGRNIVAALLNAQAGLLAPSIVTQGLLNTIWSALGSSATATWTVNATGQKWTAQETNDKWFGTLFQKAV